MAPSMAIMPVSGSQICGFLPEYQGEIVDINPGFGDVLVGYTGTSAVSVGALYGTLVAPRAKVTVENGVSLLGAIFAGTVEVHQDSAVVHYPFNSHG